MRVRTRFAPSPTGFLHVGSVRTALFSWLYAKHHQGDFILRIEDTDRERSTQASVDAILEGMAFLGLEYDEGPFYQTDRYPRYAQVAQQLLDEDKAYCCQCSKERLEQLREAQLHAHEKPRYDGHCRELGLLPGEQPCVIRFKNPTEGVVAFKDQVYGDMLVQQHELDDLVLVRSDGNPTYNFVVVVDDWDMNITHVIRGDDHLNNTPRQINLLQALGAPIPIYAHLPMILGEDGKRLSKRHGAVSVMQFKEQGILPHALLNYLVRLGWAHGDQEIFSQREMIAAFDFDHVSRAAASFDYEKLRWLTQHYQKSDPASDVAMALAWHFEKKNIDLMHGPSLIDVVKAQAERSKTLLDMCESSLYFYQDEVAYQEEDVQRFLQPSALTMLETVLEHVRWLQTWDRDALQSVINDVCGKLDIKMAQVAQPLRVAITGSRMSPSIDLTLTLIGQHRVIQRLEHVIARLREEV